MIARLDHGDVAALQAGFFGDGGLGRETGLGAQREVFFTKGLEAPRIGGGSAGVSGIAGL